MLKVGPRDRRAAKLLSVRVWTAFAMSSLLRGPGSTKFGDRWPDMQPVVLKLLKQEHVTRDEWQNLFW